MSFLQEVIFKKRARLETAKEQISEGQLEERLLSLSSTKDFMGSILQGKPGIIAEFKRSSPSRGIINHERQPLEQALNYVAGGAHAISVLTEEDYFHGSSRDLQQIANGCDLPILRKDFILNRYQLLEARCWGASAVLLIVRVLGRSGLADLMAEAVRLDLLPLVEVGNEDELEIALELSAPLIGINNRNLDTLIVDPSTTVRLMKKMPMGQPVVGESGLKTHDDVDALFRKGISAVLIGETLMRASDPQAMLRSLRGETDF